MLKYFHESAVAHSIKDLEKALPSVASINGMQVRDYLQALSDESQIHVEKIGSGNWYWSFPGEAKKIKEDQVAKATEERDKAALLVNELQAKVDAATVSREDESGTPSEPGQDRASLTKRHTELGNALKPLEVELASYSDNDPVEIEKRREAAAAAKRRVDQYTEHIQSMECYLKNQGLGGGDREAWLNIVREWYGNQFDEEEQGLKEFL